MTEPFCASRNFDLPGGELSLEPWSVPRHVADVTANSVGDGPITEPIDLPGKVMIDQQVSWTSDSPLPATILVRLHRAHRDLLTSNPNALQVRDDFTYTLDGSTPREPQLASNYSGATTLALDVGTDNVGQPGIGEMWLWDDAHMTEDVVGPLEPGQTIRLWYRCILWTPPPWSPNANANVPKHSAAVRSTRIQLIALPTTEFDGVKWRW